MSSSSVPGAPLSSGAASAVASSSRLTLDLACPVPWPDAGGEALPDAGAPHVALPLRYFETLWLGEVHSTLATLVHAAHALLRHAPAADVRAALLALLRHPSPRSSGLEERVRGVSHAQLVALLLHGAALPEWSEAEVHVVHAALRSGPGSAVAAEVREQLRMRQERQTAAAAEEAQAVQEDPEEETHGKLARRWLSAIGVRELQLQALTLLLLLQLHAEYPLPCTPGGGAASTPNTDEAAAEHATPSKISSEAARPLIDGSSEDAPGDVPAKKRRRKEPARRWTGHPGAAGFPWARPTGESSSPRVEEGALERGTSPTSLTRRFEAIIDRLALLGVTASLSFDVAPVEVARTSSARSAPPLHFGTAAREKQAGDERDELQWLCADVVEPLFGRLLPRQVAALRARAFTPGLPGATPLRPGRTRERSGAEASSELDLVRLGAAQAKRLRAEQAREKAKRPKLEEALRSESQESARGRSVARGERFVSREVSMGPGRGWERSNSVGVVVDTASAAPEEPRRLGPTLQAPARIDKRKSSAQRLDRAASQVLVANASSNRPAAPTLPARSAAITGWRRAESQPAWPPPRPALGKPASAPLFAETQPLSSSGDALAWSEDEEEEMLPTRQALRTGSQLDRPVSARTPFARSESQPAHLLHAASQQHDGGDDEMLVLRKRPKPRFSWTGGGAEASQGGADGDARPLSALAANAAMRADERSDASRSASPLPPPLPVSTSDAAMPPKALLPPRAGMAGRTASGRNPFAARRAE